VNRLAIFGLGSPFGDDRAGWAAAEVIRDSQWLRALPEGTVRVECLDRPGAGLLAHMGGVTHAVVIDAMRSGAPPGTVRMLTHEEIRSEQQANASTHGFGLAQALALGHTLGQLPPELVVFGIEAETASGLCELSPALRAAIPALVSGIRDYVLTALGLNAGVCG
jgi:hydrogenase maturation protease